MYLFLDLFKGKINQGYLIYIQLTKCTGDTWHLIFFLLLAQGGIKDRGMGEE